MTTKDDEVRTKRINDMFVAGKTLQDICDTLHVSVADVHLALEQNRQEQSTGTKTIKLVRKEVEWIVYTGPFPFACDNDATSGYLYIHWPQHTDDDVIEHHMNLATTATSMRIVRKLMGEIE